ncbi:transposase [Streptomyces sp. NBC_00513]|uniref:transposase n=1 Tax=unclassified Streptomyces TaxID=2593676 RepID=UPI002256F916|nr:transposase [Streptomyces sp. NBC_00424]MCX5076950.1 transposase [Streptomyces sp. NBC_00424]WUD40044.1 transposase [Streptomyces sp. NBC_00513]
MIDAVAWDLSPGNEFVVNGAPWTVQAFEPQVGKVVLVRPDHEPWKTSVRQLLHHPDIRPSTRTRKDLPAASRGRQPKGFLDLPPDKRPLVMLRVDHLREVESGFRSGDPLHALPGEPKPHYDPHATTLTERRLAKVRELRQDTVRNPDLAAAHGLDKVSYRTLIRWDLDRRRFGPVGCADDRWLRKASGRRISTAVREAIFAVRHETLHRSKLTAKDRERLIHQYVREEFGKDEPVPSYETLRVVWKEWFGSSGARQRYAVSAARAQAVATGRHVVVSRPGQVVALDTTVLPVKVREQVFGDPVSVHLTLALDVYTHSIVAFRLTLVSDTSVDVAMILRDVMMPLPMRPDWGEEMEWAYPGVPGTVIAGFTGGKVAGLPFFAPETVTTDHGSVYKNHHLIEVQRVIGATIRPSRVLRPTDKQAVERAFGAIQSLLFRILPGYQGIDSSDRGTDPEGDACLTVAEMEHLIATWVVKIWQNRRFGSYAPSWDPAGDHSPNTLFAASMAQGGFALQIPPAELYYQLLPTHRVMIHGRRGVKIRNLWYDGEALDEWRFRLSGRGGAARNKYVFHRDPRDPCFVFFQDPLTHEWNRLRWVGLPDEGRMPAFSDARVRQVMRELRNQGLTPKTDRDLLPLLLDLIGGNVPVEQWPTRLTKAQRTEHAREEAQAAAAAADRPKPSPAAACVDEVAPFVPIQGRSPDNVVALRWRERAEQGQAAVDGERRRRREAAPEMPAAMSTLGQRLRGRSLMDLPDDEDETAGEPGGQP